jgi:hypothetical protein
MKVRRRRGEGFRRGNDAIWRLGADSGRARAPLRRASASRLNVGAFSAYSGGMTAENPFAVLSLIAAPAILTNASSVLAMSTSNRLARTVDRAAELSKQLEATTDYSTDQAQRRLMELSACERRMVLLVGALQRIYVALGGFALASLLSLLGAVLVPFGFAAAVLGLELGGVAAGLIAVGALVHASLSLVRDTRIALFVLQERAAQIQSRVSLQTGEMREFS